MVARVHSPGLGDGRKVGQRTFPPTFSPARRTPPPPQKKTLAQVALILEQIIVT